MASEHQFKVGARLALSTLLLSSAVTLLQQAFPSLDLPRQPVLFLVRLNGNSVTRRSCLDSAMYNFAENAGSHD